ncbi:MAG: MGMT family protein [Elusimicrobiaceae bacterium]
MKNPHKLCLPPGTVRKDFAKILAADILDRIAEYPPFFQKVWLVCALIPEGGTMSYGEVARKAGSPKAARAVGMALKKNPFAPAVPCHRVIGGDGKLVGFSGPGGLKQKAELLKKEKALFKS